MQAQTGRFGALGQKGLVSFLDLNRRCKKSRYAAGVGLFAIFSRSRASDLKVCDHWDLDLEDIKTSGKGFVECVTRNHKTTRQTAQQAVPMPLIAPQMALVQLPGGPSGSKLQPSVDVLFLRRKGLFCLRHWLMVAGWTGPSLLRSFRLG